MKETERIETKQDIPLPPPVPSGRCIVHWLKVLILGFLVALAFQDASANGAHIFSSILRLDAQIVWSLRRIPTCVGWCLDC